MPQRPMTTLGMPARISTVNPSGREIQVGMRSVSAKAAPMESGHRDDDGDDRRGDGAPDDGPGAELGPLQVLHAVGVDGARRRPAAVGPGPAVEEVPAVDPDGRPGLEGQHGDGEDERGQREQHGHPGHGAPAALLVAADAVSGASVPRRLAERPPVAAWQGCSPPRRRRWSST